MTEYQITIKNKYLVLPINMNSKNKKIGLYNNGRLIFDFDAHIDFITPSFYTYLDVERFKGQTVSFRSEPHIDMRFTLTDTVPDTGLYKEELRPMTHFTPRLGWINDPNGLVYDGDRYHLFFQHNPAGSTWGNMTWGHAVSSDLISWTELEGALHPDEMGTMFSGSAIVDCANVSGLKENENDPILLFYTAAGNTSALSKGKRFTQCLAYSTDGGNTFKKYANNPIIPHVKADNRDPKVIYCDELGCYILALYLDRDEYAIFKSDNLTDWSEIQRLSLPGDDECPDIYPLSVENEEGVTKWVFSGASDIYLVGDMNEASQSFVPCQNALPAFYGKRTSYAAQTFSGTDPRRIKIAWEVLHAPSSVFENQMSVPYEISLVRLADRYRLRTLPVKEFSSLRISSEHHSVDIEHKISRPLHRKSYDIEIRAPKNSCDFTLEFLGYKIDIRVSDNTVRYADTVLPLSYTGDDIYIRLITDTLGCELFADNGLIYSVIPGIADYNIRYFTAEATNVGDAVDLDIDIHTLMPIK